jgi:hypothetical protein
MRKPIGLYIGDSKQINEDYKTYIDSLPKSCESIEQITDYLNFKLTPRGGGGCRPQKMKF